MAIVTSMRWYLIVFLIGIDWTINDVDYLCTCFYYYFTSCENSLPIESGFLKVGPVWNLFSQWFTPGHFLRAGVIYSPLFWICSCHCCQYYLAPFHFHPCFHVEMTVSGLLNFLNDPLYLLPVFFEVHFLSSLLWDERLKQNKAKSLSPRSLIF